MNAFTSLSVQSRQREALYVNKRRVQFDIPTALHTLRGTKMVTNKVRTKRKRVSNLIVILYTGF